MTDAITKTQRWLDLIAYLVGRNLPVPVEEIMEHVPAYSGPWSTGDTTRQASARRMFERDKDELRSLGIPIETVHYSVNFGRDDVEGYRLARSDFYLPYLRLLGRAGDPAPEPGPRRVGGVGEVHVAREDAAAALQALRHVADLPGFPLAREASSAYRKLSFDPGIDDVPGGPVYFLDAAGTREQAELMRLLSDALLARKRVSFRYHGIQRGVPTERELALYGLMFQGGHWYAVGLDMGRNGLRVFRVGRMDAVEVNPRAPKTPDYEIPPDFRLADYADRRAWELGAEGESPALQVQVLFPFPTSLWAERNGYGEPVEKLAGGAAVRSFEVHQLDAFLRWLLGIGMPVQVLEPAEVRGALHRMVSGVLARYDSGEEDAGA